MHVQRDMWIDVGNLSVEVDLHSDGLIEVRNVQQLKPFDHILIEIEEQVNHLDDELRLLQLFIDKCRLLPLR